MFQLSSSFYGKCSFTVKSVSWKRIHFSSQKLFVWEFCVKTVKYFDFKDQSSLRHGSAVGSSPKQRCCSDLSSGTTMVGAACPSPLMDPEQGGQVRWKTAQGQKLGERSAIAPVILVFPFFTPSSRLLHTHIHIHPVTLIHLRLCQKYITDAWIFFFATVSR